MSANLLVQKHLRRNYLLGVVNGTIFGFVDALTAPSLVLALFVAQLGGPNVLIGLLPAIYTGGWYVPQLFVAHRLERLAVKKSLYNRTSIIRFFCFSMIVAVTFLFGTDHPTLLLVLFFIPFVIYSFAAGFGGNAFMTVVAKTIPSRRRGSFFAYRELTGTAAGILAGYLISVTLSPSNSFGFPHNFGLLFLVDWAAINIGMLLFAFVIEPREQVGDDAVPFQETLRQARRIWSENHTYRRYLLMRIVIALADIATPFYAIYAIRQLRAPESIVGLYVSLTTVAAMLINPAWTWIGNRFGIRPVIVSAALGWVLMPCIAFLFLFSGGSAALAAPFGLLFIVYGIGRTAANISFPVYLLEVAPAAERALYIGLTNTLLGVATFIPVVGGILLDLFGFSLLFTLSLVIALGGLYLALGLRESRRPAAAAAVAE